PDKQEGKTTGTDEGTDTKLGVYDVPKYLSKSENESWGDSSDDDGNDDDCDEVTNDDDDDDIDSDADGDKEASDSEKTNSDEEEEHEEELQATAHEEEGKGDEEMNDAGRDDGTQQTTYEQVKDDEHVILTTVHDTQKTEVPLQIVSMMNVKVRHEEPSTQTPPLLSIPVTVIPKTSTATRSTIPQTIPPITPLTQQSIPAPTPAPTTATTTTSIPALPDFSSLFGFNQRVSALEKELSQFKQADYSAQLLEMIKSQIPALVDAQLRTILEDSIKKSFRSYTTKFEKKDKDKRKRYIDLIEKSMKDIIKDEVKSQLPHILPKEVSDYATPVI
ncbi:hypothetical protein Tco_0048262, partial [Tanacetum coccineum]